MSRGGKTPKIGAEGVFLELLGDPWLEIDGEGFGGWPWDWLAAGVTRGNKGKEKKYKVKIFTMRRTDPK